MALSACQNNILTGLYNTHHQITYKAGCPYRLTLIGVFVSVMLVQPWCSVFTGKGGTGRDNRCAGGGQPGGVGWGCIGRDNKCSGGGPLGCRGTTFDAGKLLFTALGNHLSSNGRAEWIEASGVVWTCPSCTSSNGGGSGARASCRFVSTNSISIRRHSLSHWPFLQ